MMQPGVLDALIQVLQKIAAHETVTFPLEITMDGQQPGGQPPADQSSGSSASSDNMTTYALNGGGTLQPAA